MPTLRPHRPGRVPRLAVDHWPPSPRTRPTHLHPALQPRAAPSSTRAPLARIGDRSLATARRSSQASRPTRGTHPRIPPRRSMNPHFETLQDVLALEVIQELVI